jgi:hypothetical protein
LNCETPFPPVSVPLALCLGLVSVSMRIPPVLLCVSLHLALLRCDSALLPSAHMFCLPFQLTEGWVFVLSWGPQVCSVLCSGGQQDYKAAQLCCPIPRCFAPELICSCPVSYVWATRSGSPCFLVPYSAFYQQGDEDKVWTLVF